MYKSIKNTLKKVYFYLMKTKHKWKYHTLIISVVVLMNFFGQYVIGGMDSLSKEFTLPLFYYTLSFNLVFFSIYFFNFYVVCPLTLKKNEFYKFILFTILSFILFASLRYFLEEVILFNITEIHNYAEKSRRIGFYFFDNTYFALKAILYSTILFLFFQHNENKSRLHQLEIDHKKAEVNYLKSQISPHFLFNTLNAFYVELIDDKPETAKDIHKLSELLRFVTYESQDEFLSLKSEIKFLEDYIYFYYKRFENELFIDFKVNGLVDMQQIPSLILIHFVENVFKHGIINDKDNPVKINITIENGYLELTTENKFITSEKYTSKGIGKTNVERRLTAIFKKDYVLNYDNGDDSFKAYLKIPLK